MMIEDAPAKKNAPRPATLGLGVNYGIGVKNAIYRLHGKLFSSRSVKTRRRITIKDPRSKIYKKTKRYNTINLCPITYDFRT
jgi:hypothetical protein